jgi:NADPH:quinone reductase-like Zn-dependent oxidoreductase
MSPFKAYLIEETEGRAESGFTTLEVAQLDPAEVTIRVACQSINCKEALVETGAGCTAALGIARASAGGA